ncbi:MAG: VIT domain-containing protein [Blastocatellia bacterium]
MTMIVGDRTVKGKIKRREEAQVIYEAAREAGHTASLLDQEHPNIFTQSVDQHRSRRGGEDHDQLRRISEKGGFFTLMLQPPERVTAADAATRRFHERVRNPLLTDIEIDWAGLPVADVYPKRLPDLFSAKPLILTGRYTAASRGVIRLRGKLAGQNFVKQRGKNRMIERSNL